MVHFTISSTTAANISIADAGGFTATTTAEAALQEIYQDLLSTQSFVGIPLESLLETDATNIVARLGVATTPVLDMANGDTDSVLTVSWVATNVDEVLFQVPLPPDFDPTADLVLHIRAAMEDVNDTPTIGSDTYFNEGDTKVEDVSAAITGTSYAEYTITVAASDIPAGAQTVTMELTPGAHGSDVLYITAMWLEYTRSILTS